MTAHNFLDPNYPMTIKDQPYPRRMQVTLEGGPFHGQRIDDWGAESSQGRWFLRHMMAGALRSALLSENEPQLWEPNIRTVRYELQRWNEAGTAGIAVCVDDGKPKCKSQYLCQMTEHRMRQVKAQNPELQVEKTKSCPVCGRPTEFKVWQAN